MSPSLRVILGKFGAGCGGAVFGAFWAGLGGVRLPFFGEVSRLQGLPSVAPLICANCGGAVSEGAGVWMRFRACGGVGVCPWFRVSLEDLRTSVRLGSFEQVFETSVRQRFWVSLSEFPTESWKFSTKSETFSTES